MTIGAVIVTHNSASTIQTCIQSLLDEGITDIIVVDSNSSDNTANILRTQKSKTILLRENKGFGYAANKGARVLNTDYVLFLNPDAYIQKGFAASILDTFAKDLKTGIVGGLLVDATGVPEQSSYGNTITMFEMFVRQFHQNIIPNKPASVGWVSGGALVIQRKLFQDIGGFDESFFLYWEDVDICRRVHESGFAVYVDPNARATHLRGASSKDLKQKTALYDASANRYFQKYYPPLLCHIHLVMRKLYRRLRPFSR